MNAPSQGLILLRVTSKDEDEYHCRVDFHDSPTRNVRVQLNVASSPTRLVIRNEAGIEVNGVIGPYALGGLLRLTCQADGGRPSPLVRWYHGTRLIDDVMEAVSDESVSNTFSMENLSRKHLFMVLTCRASNHNLTEDVVASVKLDLTFPPSEILILGTENPLRAGWTYDITCEVWGSRPPPAITWWRDGRLVPTTHQLTVEGNVSRSRLEIIPQRGDEGALYSCRAENELLPSGGAIEQAKRITVLYPPEVYLKAGHRINLKDIKEGDDVYFECSAEANPKSHHVSWFRDNDELTHNVTAGIIRSNLSLVLQKVTRFSSGNYVCVASNSLASTSSNKLRLDVKFRPVCAPNQKLVYGGGRHEPVHITCNVDALPEASKFHWAFNTSTELVDLPQQRAKTSEGKSVVTYMPQTRLDYGSLLCWGVNEVGKQRQPCVFQVVPAGPPESPKNCTAWHEFGVAGEMMVSCRAGRDGGLPQKFSLEISEEEDGVLLMALRDRPHPRFSVKSLKPGTEYVLKITSSNIQGSAPPVIFTHFTPIDIAEERMSASAAGGEEESFGSESLVAIICGICAAVILTFGLLFSVIRLKMIRTSPRITKVSDDDLQKSFAEESSQGMASNPDVILASDENVATASKDCGLRKEKNVTFDLESDPHPHSSHVILRPLSLSSVPNYQAKVIAVPPPLTHPSTSCYLPVSSFSPTPSSATTTAQSGVGALHRHTKPPGMAACSHPFNTHHSPMSEIQPLLMVPPLPPVVSFRDQTSRVEDLTLPLHQELSPPEEFSCKESFSKEEKPPSKDLDSPQKESSV